MGYPRRAALIRAARAALLRLAGAAALIGAVAGASGAGPVGLAGLALAVALLGAGRLEAGRAERARIGARSEAMVAERLWALEADGWQVRHGVRWRARGDIDHLVEAPGGQRFVVETKTARYTSEQLARTRAAARALSRRGRSCTPVLCVARRRGRWWIEAGVEVVSADLLAARLRQLAGGG
jgi:hypothetical protein